MFVIYWGERSFKKPAWVEFVYLLLDIIQRLRCAIIIVRTSQVSTAFVGPLWSSATRALSTSGKTEIAMEETDYSWVSTKTVCQMGPTDKRQVAGVVFFYSWEGGRCRIVVGIRGKLVAVWTNRSPRVQVNRTDFVMSLHLHHSYMYLSIFRVGTRNCRLDFPIRSKFEIKSLTCLWTVGLLFLWMGLESYIVLKKSWELDCVIAVKKNKHPKIPFNFFFYQWS